QRTSFGTDRVSASLDQGSPTSADLGGRARASLADRSRVCGRRAQERPGSAARRAPSRLERSLAGGALGGTLCLLLQAYAGRQRARIAGSWQTCEGGIRGLAHGG